MPRGGKGVKNSPINKIIIIDHKEKRTLIKKGNRVPKGERAWQYEDGAINELQLAADIKEITKFQRRLSNSKTLKYNSSYTDTKIDEQTCQIDLRIQQRKRGRKSKNQPSTSVENSEAASASSSSASPIVAGKDDQSSMDMQCSHPANKDPFYCTGCDQMINSAEVKLEPVAQIT